MRIEDFKTYDNSFLDFICDRYEKVAIMNTDFTKVAGYEKYKRACLSRAKYRYETNNKKLDSYYLCDACYNELAKLDKTISVSEFKDYN